MQELLVVVIVIAAATGIVHYLFERKKDMSDEYAEAIVGASRTLRIQRTEEKREFIDFLNSIREERG